MRDKIKVLSSSALKPEIVDATEETEPPGQRGLSLSVTAHDQFQAHVINDPLLPLQQKITNLAFRRADRFKVSPLARAFQQRYFPSATLQDWNDWQWQLRNRITTVEGLTRFLALSDDEAAALERGGPHLPMAITPYYASLLLARADTSAIRRTVVPASGEFLKSKGEAVDPLGEDSDSPVDGLVHRYPDRVLFLTTDFCSVNCRYCTRSRIVCQGHGEASRDRWEKALAYIEAHSEVRDVLLSGGDPLTMADDRIEWLLSRLRRIKHVEFIRIGTKVPVVLPQRITPTLCRMLKKYHPLWMSIHFTHPLELTAETSQACERLADAGIPLGSQTVLLKGVNDNVETLKSLFHGLLRVRVKPYYLYQCDPIAGSAHFRTTVAKGIEIIRGLRGHTTGYAVPTYVIDAPGGGGKIPVGPDYVLGHEGNDLVLTNYHGGVYRYPEPEAELVD